MDSAGEGQLQEQNPTCAHVHILVDTSVSGNMLYLGFRDSILASGLYPRG